MVTHVLCIGVMLVGQPSPVDIDGFTLKEIFYHGQARKHVLPSRTSEDACPTIAEKRGRIIANTYVMLRKVR
ncbi:MAG: hypothetical protein ACUBOA_13045 [Candidatus Loosdrechtia sp.]|uniref:hypothetical protein n=1 Tax=Candidatus Loosdrechtia sp. TaxID=3101272 RepID=UPI003A5D47C3|nr:MAG: hypothetical protein QY305_09980 [Candidatus Jettenia sp. AMX2]